MASALLGYAGKASALHDEACGMWIERGCRTTARRAEFVGLTYLILGDDERGIECEKR